MILTNLFKPLPVRRKEFERNHKREYAKATNLLTAYALIPCSSTPNKTKGVRLTLTNTLPTGKKQTHVLAPGADAGSMAIATGLWGSKSLEGVCEFQIHFDVVFPKAGESPSQYVLPFPSFPVVHLLDTGRKSKSTDSYPTLPKKHPPPTPTINSSTSTKDPACYPRFKKPSTSSTDPSTK